MWMKHLFWTCTKEQGKPIIKSNKENINLYILNAFAIFVIFCINILFNGWICKGDRVFYLDDLYTVSCCQANTFIEYTFNTLFNKIRPISNLVMWLCLKLIGRNYELIDEILLLINFVNAVLIYVFAYAVQHKSGSVFRTVMSCVCAMMFIASRFAYYNISEFLGIMESMGNAFAIGMLMLLYMYTEKKDLKWYYMALVLYTLLIWTHERYFVLIVLFMIVLLFQNDINWVSKCQKFLWPMTILISFWLIRILLLGNRAWDGTSGTSISDTFDVKTAISFCCSQVGYILGFNLGPQYLNGLEYKQVSTGIKLLLLFNLIFILWITASYVKLLIKDTEFRKDNIKQVILLISFIGLCIVCSSVTIRVEMRWIYVSYMAYLILLFYMIQDLSEYYPLNTGKIAIFSVFVILTFASEQYYRSNYQYIYYWTHKDLSRELYNATVKKYGEALENRDIIIIGDFWKEQSWPSNDWKLFFSPYIDSDNINVIYADDIYDASQYLQQSNNAIVLLEDKDNKEYSDITKKVNLIGVKYLYGIYEDCWCDMDCAFEVRGNMYRKVVLQLYYPNDLEVKGIPNGTIMINGENKFKYELTGQLTTIELDLPSQSINTIQINANYWVHEGTNRSEDGRLSNTLYIDIR